MTKKYFIKLILLFSILVILSVSTWLSVYLLTLRFQPPLVINPPAEDFYSCVQDSDCVSVKADCCGCTAGGKATAVSRNFKKEWQDKLSKECQGIFCEQVISNDPSCFKAPKCVNNKCVLETPEEKVVISTDKTEYKQGEIIKIVVNNGLDKPILYDSNGGRFWDIEYFENDKWINAAYEKDGGFQLTEKSIGEACYIALYERSFPEELSSQSNLTVQWNQKICPFGTESLNKPKIVKYIENGKYRLVFYYGFEISGNDPFQILEPKKVYSNEFTIKEKLDVSIATDKTEYGMGEPVKITITNHQDEPIYTSPYDAFPSTYFISKFTGSKWQRISQNCQCEWGCTDGVLTTCPQFVPPAPYFREFKGPFSGEWRQTACASKNQMCGDKPYTAVIDEQVETGRYKVGFCYWNKKDIDLTKEVDYAPQEKKKCVEKEFTIKEKSTGKESPFSTILKGERSEYPEKKNYLIKTEEEWAMVLQKTGAELPESIDFSKNMAIAVFQGEQITGGYSIEITKIVEKENNIEVFVKETSPGRNCIVEQAFTRPYHIVKLQKSDKEVSFKTETVVTQCD